MAAKAQKKSRILLKKFAYILNGPGSFGVARLRMTRKALRMTKRERTYCVQAAGIHNYSKHSLMVWMMASCWSGVILLSLGRQSPRSKMSAPTSVIPPAM